MKSLYPLFLLFLLLACQENSFQKTLYKPIDYSPPAGGVKVSVSDETSLALPAKKAIYSIIETNQGSLVLELFHQEAPHTVQNFIDLAQGKKETVSVTGAKEKKRFYDGLTFHRIIPNFMIQGGCPKGDGTGGPGYRFDDEINAVALGLDKVKLENAPYYSRQLEQSIIKSMNIKSQKEMDERMKEAEKNLTFARDNFSIAEILFRVGYRYNEVLNSRKALRGSLAMANAGPNTNGSQFFINQVDTPHLDGLHTVFGQLVNGYDVLDAIVEFSQPSQDENSEPGKVVINKVLIVDRR